MPRGKGNHKFADFIPAGETAAAAFRETETLSEVDAGADFVKDAEAVQINNGSVGLESNIAV